MKYLIIIFLVFICLIGHTTVYYIATDGNDTTGDGSIGSPYFTLNKAWTVISAGDTVYLRGGTYEWDTWQDLTGKSGTEGNYISILAYGDESPVITKGSSYGVYTMIYATNSDYLYLRGLEISGFEHVSGEYPLSQLAFEDCNYCIWEDINYHHTPQGARIKGTSTGNLVYNCDFHHNYDPYRDGDPYGGADGLNVTYIDAGLENTIRSCRFWNNSDDGLDAWENDGNMIVDSCWAWNNGYQEDEVTTGGDGTGLKLGVTTTDYTSEFKRTITNNLAFNNRLFGISQNGALCKMYIYNNTIYGNDTGIYFSVSWGNAASLMRNNIAYNNSTNANINQSAATIDYNSWNGFTVNSSDFLSIDTTGVSGARQADGSLPILNFLKLASTSALINGGINTGIEYVGTSPDLGYNEFTDFLMVKDTVSVGQWALYSLGTTSYVAVSSIERYYDSNHGIVIADTVFYVPATASTDTISNFTRPVNMVGAVTFEPGGDWSGDDNVIAQDSMYYSRSAGTGSAPIVNGIYVK